jgi:conjugal transfer mating pair stabilization protein TraG
MGWSYESSGSQTDRALLQEAESLSHRYSESGLSSQQFAAALSAGIGASNKSDRGAVTEAIKGILRGGGTLTGTYATNEQLQDQIADEIARRVSSDRDFSARLAEGVKADTQSGTRNVFAERLTQEERSTLQAQAADTITAARSLERSETMAERFGTLGSYRAVEIGHAVAGDPGLMDRMYDRIDQLGLTGDHPGATPTSSPTAIRRMPRPEWLCCWATAKGIGSCRRGNSRRRARRGSESSLTPSADRVRRASNLDAMRIWMGGFRPTAGRRTK